MALVPALTLLLAVVRLVSGSYVPPCVSTTYTKKCRAPSTSSSTVRYTDLDDYGWNVPGGRLPQASVKSGDFYSIMCNSMKDCTPQTPPYDRCIATSDTNKACLESGLGNQCSKGVGEVRIAYKCARDNTNITFWVLEYLYNYNGAGFSSAGNWWVAFNGGKVVYKGNGQCETQQAVSNAGVRCQHAWLVTDVQGGTTKNVGVLYQMTLSSGSPPRMKLQVHAEWLGGSESKTAATGTPEVCFTPCTSVEHDPHFVGAHGTRYDFGGLPGKSFCLLTDVDVHVNMLTAGYYDRTLKGALRSWIRELVIMWRAADRSVHKLHLVARSGPSVEYGSGYLVGIALDGVASPTLQIGESLDVPSLRFQLERANNNPKYRAGVEEVYFLSIGDRLEATITLRPAHPKLRTAEDAYVHLSMSLHKVETTGDVHGVLGQTYRNDRVGRTTYFQKLYAKLHLLQADGASGKGFLDGNTTDYVTSGVLSPDCTFNRFSEEAVPRVAVASSSSAAGFVKVMSNVIRGNQQ